MRLPYKSPVPYAMAAVTLGLLTLTACGSSHKSSSGGSPSTSGCSATGTSANQVDVCETEYHISLSTASFTAGSYTFVAQDKGSIEHSLAIKGPGVDVTSSLLGPGQSADLHVTLQAGTYELWCPVDGHKALGMDTHITVGA